MTVEEKLASLGITLPEAAAPAANYVPYVLSGKTLYIAGQIPLVSGKVQVTGQLGDLEISDGQFAAEICAINIIAQAKAALGDLNKISRISKINVLVSSTPDFFQHHLVANGASDVFVKLLGDAGKHARAAFGVAALPLNAAVEVDAIIEVDAV